MGKVVPGASENSIAKLPTAEEKHVLVFQTGNEQLFLYLLKAWQI